MGKGSFSLGVGYSDRHQFMTNSHIQIGGRQFFNVSYTRSGDINLGRNGLDGINAISINGGKAWFIERYLPTRFSVSAGPSYVWGRDIAEDAIGLSLQSNLISEPLIKGLGIGLNFNSNINNQKSFWGVGFSLLFIAY